MNIFKLKSILFSSLLLLLITRSAFSEDKIKNIIIFFSYNSTLPAYQKVLEGLKSALNEKKADPTNIIVEYLDIGRSEDEAYPRFIIELYKKKIKEIKFDLIIIVGPDINPLLQKYGDDLLSSVPVINIDIAVPGRITLKDLKIKNGIEIILKFKVNNTLSEAFALCPGYKNIFIINGISKLDAYFETILRNCKNEFGPEYNFHFISGLTLDSTIHFVRNISPKSIVVVGSFLQDANKVVFSTPEVLHILSNNSPAPVFSLTDAFNKKESGIGGYILSYVNVGREAGRISGELLHGKSLDKITVDSGTFYQHIYDWHEMEKWHLQNSGSISKKAILYNKNHSFFSLYKWYLLGLLLFLLLQTISILYLMRMNRRQKSITYRMMVTESMYRQLIRTDRLAKMATLTASLSHELFQPLSAIRYTAQAGKRILRTEKLDPEQATLLFDNILEDNQRATGIINSVKSLMKKETPQKGNVNLNSLIHETVDIVRSEAIRNSITILLKIDTEPVFIFGDKIQLQQVLINFIRNATTAMENIDNNKRTLLITMNLKKESVIVSVRDSGCGIDISIREKLFKPFTTTKGDGFGIGLTLCKSLIENHNGEIWAENIPEGGSQFSFSLPVIKKQEII